jgi:predicted CopG family antitoxin
MVFDMKNRVNVGLRYEVYNRLKDRGKFGESFSELVLRLINELDTTISNNRGKRTN